MNMWGPGTDHGQGIVSRKESVTSRPEHFIPGARPSKVLSLPLAQLLFQPDVPRGREEQSLLPTHDGHEEQVRIKSDCCKPLQFRSYSSPPHNLTSSD